MALPHNFCPTFGEHFTTNNAIYGYKKDPEDKDHWLVDEEAAAVVRRIFRLAVEGHGPHEIAKILTQEKVECPAYYLARNGRGSRKNTVDTSRPYDWYGFTVSSMLTKPEYMGHTVNFRSSKKSYRDKRVKNDPSDWLIFENTHEAIVDPETWQLAQQVKRTVRRTDTTGVANPLTGLVFCADCGAKMYNHRGKRKKDGREYGTDFYNCSTYTLTFERETQMCFSHTVSTKALNALILETIRTTASYAIQNKEEFIQKVRSISQVRQQEAAKELKRKVAKERRRSAELDVLIKKLYETYAMGKLEEKRFELLCAEYEKEQAELEQLLASEQAQLDQFHEDTDRVSHFLALAQKYTDFTELTAPMLHEFVEKILVHAPDRSTGERVQEIEIMSRFGRDYLQVGMYTEIMFPEHDIHFIAVNDGVDSTQGDNEFTPFRNIINEWYAKDTSKKIRAVMKVKGNAGEHLATLPPYGYMKSPDDKKQWVKDEEAAQVVYEIGLYIMDGLGPSQIARKLTERKILTPAAYYASKGRTTNVTKKGSP